MKKILIDCDPGMDDSLAVILAAKSPELDVLGISTVAGNYPIEITAPNALKTLELIGKTEIPVARGSDKPLVRPLPPDPFWHGTDGLGHTYLPEPKTKLVDKHAVDLIIDAVKAHSGEVSLACLAPLTNVAAAFTKDPSIKASIKEIVCIAGSFGLNRFAYLNATGGTPQSEWNVFVDPEAAKLVFESGVPIRAIGLDIATHFDINFSQADLAALKSSPKKEANYLERMAQFVLGRGFESYCVLIDSMAIAALIDPAIITTQPARVGVETKGELTLGQTIADFRHHFAWQHLPLIEVAYQADFRRFLDLVMARVTQ